MNSTAEIVQDVVAHHDVGLITPDVTMTVLTIVTFLILLWVLGKFAWKPILEGLDRREEVIRKSLADAQAVTEELNKVLLAKEAILSEAQRQANDILAESRKAAQETARVIEQAAQKRAQEFLDTARQDIVGERAEALDALRKESVDIALRLTQKLIQKNFDEQENRLFINRVMDKS